MTSTAEHLVIGSGAGGALTAALLAEAGRDVLVLEEGPWVEPDSVEPFSLDQMAHQYRNGGVSAMLGRPPIAYAEGRCAGGSTEVNAGLYHLAGAVTLERWRSSHWVDGLTPAELEPYAAQVREALSVRSLPEGTATPASLKLVAGAERLGWPVAEVPRWYRYDDGQPVKQSMTRTYLPRAQRAGARLRTGVRADRLLVRDGRVGGARTSAGLVTAERTWVCAGAIGTAALLQRSGLGRGVGQTLQGHPTVKAAARFVEPLLADRDVPVHQVKPAGGDVSFGGSASRPGFVALALADDWPANRAAADAWETTGVYYAAIRPEGRGRVRTVPGLREPLVTYVLTRADMRRLAGGLADLVRLMLAAGAVAVHPGVAGGGAITREDEVRRLRRRVTRAGTSVMTVHLFSTVPMGEHPDRCPADSYGVVRGVRGLQVNDASLLPDAPGVNPQGTLMAVAARNVAAHLSRGP